MTFTRKSSGDILFATDINGIFDGIEGKTPRLIAASDSPDSVKKSAYKVLTGTSDQTIINTVINDYKNVQLSEGTFNISGPIVMKSNSSLIGSGITTHIVRDGTLVSSNAHGISVTFSTDVILRNFSLSGPSVSATMVAGDGIMIDNASRVFILDTFIDGFGALGDDGSVAVTASAHIMIRGGRHHDNLNGPIFGKAGGVTPPSCTDILVQNMILDHNWADGSHGQQCDRIQWIGNRSYSNGESGIDLLGCWDCVVLGNVSTGNGHEGIEVGQTVAANREDRGHVIVGNTCTANHTFTGAGGGGILLSGKTSACLVSGNVCRNNLHAGIHLGNTSSSYLIDNNLVSNNVCENNTQVGIHISGNAIQNTIDGNIVQNNKDRGIDMTTSGSVTPLGIVVVNNTILDNTGVPLYRSGGIDSTITVRNNVGYLTESKGKAVIPDTAGNVVVNHGLAVAPVSVVAVPDSTGTLIGVTAITATTFTVARAGTSGITNIYWYASV